MRWRFGYRITQIEYAFVEAYVPPKDIDAVVPVPQFPVRCHRPPPLHNSTHPHLV